MKIEAWIERKKSTWWKYLIGIVVFFTVIGITIYIVSRGERISSLRKKMLKEKINERIASAKANVKEANVNRMKAAKHKKKAEVYAEEIKTIERDRNEALARIDKLKSWKDV